MSWPSSLILAPFWKPHCATTAFWWCGLPVMQEGAAPLLASKVQTNKNARRSAIVYCLRPTTRRTAESAQQTARRRLFTGLDQPQVSGRQKHFLDIQPPRPACAWLTWQQLKKWRQKNLPQTQRAAKRRCIMTLHQGNSCKSLFGNGHQAIKNDAWPSSQMTFSDVLWQIDVVLWR